MGRPNWVERSMAWRHDSEGPKSNPFPTQTRMHVAVGVAVKLKKNEKVSRLPMLIASMNLRDRFFSCWADL